MRIPPGARSVQLCVRSSTAAAAAAAVLLGAFGGSQAVATPARTTEPTAAAASFTAVDYAWTTNGNPDTNGSTVTIQAGQTVTFSYPSGSSVHNADFNNPSTNAPPAVPPICQRTDGVSDSGGNPPLPHSPQAPGWSGQCTFNTPGSYSFHCDAHPFMTGTIDVVAATTSTSSSTSTSSTGSSSSQTSTATTSTSATTTSTTVTSMSTGTYGSTSTTTSASAPSPGHSPTGPAIAQISVSPHQRGGTVHGSVRVVGSDLRLNVTLRAKRAAIAPASTSSASVTVAHLSRHPVGPGAVSFALKVSAKPAAGRKLSLVMVLQLTSAKGRTVIKDRDITLARS